LNNAWVAIGPRYSPRLLPPDHQSRNNPKHTREIIDPMAIKQSMATLKSGWILGRGLMTVQRKLMSEWQNVVTN
jgi:hypothetical protein